MHNRMLTIPPIGRAAGLILVAAAIFAAAVLLHLQDEPPTAISPPPVAHVDPLAAELARCQALGMAAENDTACDAAWAENRRRFFTLQPVTGGPASEPSTTPSPPPSRDR
jgi:conjugative transfer region protein TrbK